MSLFWADSISIHTSNVEAAKKWWIESFGCEEAKMPEDWDDPLPSDVALKLPGSHKAAILLSGSGEDLGAGFERSSDHPILFCAKLTKAQEYLRSKGLAVGPIQSAGGTEFFEIRDPDGKVIEVCKEP